MKLKEIHRTSTFAWSPFSSLPLLATGSVAGALDESFSNESQLEIWAPDFLDKHEYDLGREGQNGPRGLVTDNARFNRLAWGHVDATHSKGVIAAGMENGDLTLWDPAKILDSADDALILRNNTHTGPIRGLDFNPIQTNLLSSGAVNGEVYIWDLKDPSKPYSPTPGTRSTKLDEITSVAWNQQVQYVLAGASSTGYTVVWDLRGKREVVALAYGGGAGTLAGQTGAGSGMALGGRRGMSDIAWHPDNATRLVTASEDDSSPIIMVWDLRNARAPEKILTGHEKGVLSLSWCKQDADLLLSCGKDNRALCWNPQTSEIIGELPSADNWAFQVDWCPRNPDMLATAFFDGTIGIHSIQTTNASTSGAAATAAPKADGSDVFDAPGFTRSNTSGGTLSLKQPPKWLRRPASSSFGFGGRLTSVSNLHSAQGKNQSSVVHLRKVVTESEVIERAQELQAAIEGGSLSSFAEAKAGDGSGSESWKALLSLFRADSREELVTLLGFSKEEVAVRVAEAIQTLKSSTVTPSRSYDLETDITESEPREPVVSFLEPEREDASDGEPNSAGAEKTPSEVSASVNSDATSGVLHADGESTTTAPSLFGDDVGPGTPQHGSGLDFFSTISQNEDSLQSMVPHTNYGLDSSVAATVGSRASSVASETLKNNSFRIYPTDESETDRLLTKALVLGDFESAVSLCLSVERYADAILLAVKGGKDLLEKTQKAYFERQTTTFPYLRLFQSIVSNDLADIVQNADLQEWQEIFVVLCTFATQEEFPSLAEQLGSRLEFQYTLIVAEGGQDAKASFAYRKNATLTYLAAGRLERLVSIWAEEMAEEEKELAASDAQASATRFAVHAQALQGFIEKVTVFRSAINYTDADLAEGNPNVQNYKLSTLYDRYFEYADTLASQGLVKEAAKYLKLVPASYKGNEGADSLSAERERLLRAAGENVRASAAAVIPAALPSLPASNSAYPSYSSYGAVPAVQNLPPAPVRATNTAYASYTPSAPSVQHAAPAVANAYTPAQSTTVPTTGYEPVVNNPYAPSAPATSYNSLTQPPHLRAQPQQQVSIPAPPPPRVGGTPNPPMSNNVPPPAPPPKRQENGGWNDAPVVDRRTPAPQGGNKLNAITSPFPNASPIGSPFTSPGQVQQATLPPPPRPGSVQGGMGVQGGMPPPPPQGRMQPPPLPGQAQGQFSAPPNAHNMPPPPGGAMPPHTLPPQRQMTPSQYAQGPARATPPPGNFARAPPQQGGPGPYGRPMTPPAQHQHQQGQQQQQNPGPYGPPPGAQNQRGPGPQGMHSPPDAQMQPPLQGMPPRQNSGAPAPAPARKGPPPPKYPVGDRGHIPESDKPAFLILSDHLERLRQNTPPQQRRIVDDLERRINPLFDSLNCETLSRPVVERLLALTSAMQAHDRPAALAIHMDLLTKGSPTDDIGLWMSGIKQLIMRL